MPDRSVSSAERHILFVEDDPLFRGALKGYLEGAGIPTKEFATGEAILEHMETGTTADLALVDWFLPGISGISLLEQIKKRKNDIGVVFLTSAGDQVREEEALQSGASEFIEKSRSFSIVLRRIRGVLDRREGFLRQGSGPLPKQIICDELTLCPQDRRAFWKDQPVSLTWSEFKIVHLLVMNYHQDVSFRQLYDEVRGSGFVSGAGPDGYRTNVRTIIMRVRQKFRLLDDEFNRIRTFVGFGYRWVSDQPPRVET